MNKNEQFEQRQSRSAQGAQSPAGLQRDVRSDLPNVHGAHSQNSSGDTSTGDADIVRGEFLDFAGERYYAIRNVDRMAPFFISVISSSDHWLFASSTGGLTAGRVSPESALFPYIPVDRVHESATHTGSTTILRVRQADRWRVWEPFNSAQSERYELTRNLYKNVLGNKLCFEEVNHELQLVFRYTWCTSDEHGFVRTCELEDLSASDRVIDMLDGLRNILPAGTPSFTQATASNLVDAYRWTELDTEAGLAIFALYSGISDRAEPAESLRANTVFSLGVEPEQWLISSDQVVGFRAGNPVCTEDRKRGVRGDYFVRTRLQLPPASTRQWAIIANTGQTQGQIVALKHELRDPPGLMKKLSGSVSRGDEELARIIASADGFQVAAEENVTAHHYANVLFNVLRGGVFDDQYTISAEDFRRHIENFSRTTYARNQAWLDRLPKALSLHELLTAVGSRNQPQLERLCYEYLPITFGRRHGDPSRPWNKFSIRLKDDLGRPLLFYEGNWRDIFQNWEAMVFSFPEFVESTIARFVNASTVDGYNPYRITKDGIDWEVEEPHDPWSYIGYWGDHQIIYLLKLLELSSNFHPGRLRDLLRRQIFSYANVPYRIKPFESLVENPKATVDFDSELHRQISARVAEYGADGRLVIDEKGEVQLVNLLEKLLVPLLAKLGNLVVDGGIWLNTQRPEWNDANNALVGHGLSMVTLCYMRRYVRFLQDLLRDESVAISLSAEVSRWLSDSAVALEDVRSVLGPARIKPAGRFEALRALGLAASKYRQSVYAKTTFSEPVERSVSDILSMLDAALAAIDHSISTNRREDGLYHAYNLLNLGPKSELAVDELYLMLEGQVAALSSGAMPPEDAVGLMEALFESALFRCDQYSFMLYPDRELPNFLGKNRIPASKIDAVPLLRKMLDDGDERVIYRDTDGCVRFNADFSNVGELNCRLDGLALEYGDDLSKARQSIRDLYESVFNHRAFTGRSGGMFGFEGLGCIYWHMVSKLLLAVQENFFSALDNDADPATCRRLGHLYYRVREGIGFNKTPTEYGAFPIDPYSHTPGHSGAQQPGMTGQVKEEILTRFGELGLRVIEGAMRFQPRLLRGREFSDEARQLRFLDVDGQWNDIRIPKNALAFTWCQVPVIYQLVDEPVTTVRVTTDDGQITEFSELCLPPEMSAQIFDRSGHVRSIEVQFSKRLLLQ